MRDNERSHGDARGDGKQHEAETVKPGKVFTR